MSALFVYRFTSYRHLSRNRYVGMIWYIPLRLQEFVPFHTTVPVHVLSSDSGLRVNAPPILLGEKLR